MLDLLVCYHIFFPFGWGEGWNGEFNCTRVRHFGLKRADHTCPLDLTFLFFSQMVVADLQ